MDRCVDPREDTMRGSAIEPTDHEVDGLTMRRIEMMVRLPWNMRPKTRIVIRAYKETGEITATLEAIRVESAGTR